MSKNHGCCNLIIEDKMQASKKFCINKEDFEMDVELNIKPGGVTRSIKLI